MYNTVKCPVCNQIEYVGMMYWRDGKTMCRHCMMKIWKEIDKSTCDDFKFYYPFYENGENYAIKQTVEKQAK